jgi:3-phosphoshikimate 1-carboxyvinyltransferase
MDGGRLSCPDDVVNAENSGTTIRIMVGVASLLPCHTVLTGDESIRRRPMQPLIDALREMGVECASTRGNGQAPLIVRGPNRGGETHIRGDVSSQFISSLLICSPPKDVDTEVVLTAPLKSRPYVEITMGMMREFGVEVEMTDKGFRIPGRQRYKASNYKVPGDYSSAAFMLVAGALGDGVVVSGLDPNDKQGDKAILHILEDFGAGVISGASSVRALPGELRATEVDLSDAPDLFPIVSVLATQAKGQTVIKNAEHVRHKESDRIASTTDFLKAMGADIQEKRDGCLIKGPVELHGTEIDSLGDHRILMAGAVAGTIAKGTTTISQGESYYVSYPRFIDDIRTLGGKVELLP